MEQPESLLLDHELVSTIGVDQVLAPESLERVVLVEDPVRLFLSLFVMRPGCGHHTTQTHQAGGSLENLEKSGG